MENLRDKMLNAIKSVPDVDRYFENYEAFAEACARVAEEEIAKVIEEAITYAGAGDNLVSTGYLKSIKRKYLKSLK